MCGIVGYIRKNNFLFDEKVFNQLLIANQLRGKHSTGVFNSNGDSIRALGTPEELLDDLDYIKMSHNIQWMVGHNRHATMGKISIENAHPFSKDGIILCHNGTLNSHKELADTEIDSQAICHSMADIGDIKTLEKIDGAFALAWRSKKGDLNLCRNKDRPLWIAETPWYIAFASEKLMLEWIIERNRDKILSIYELPIGEKYRWDIKKQKFFVTKINLKTPSYYGNLASRYGFYNPDKYWDNYEGKNDVSKSNLQVHLTNKKNLSSDIGTKVTFRSISMSVKGYLSGLTEDTNEIVRYYGEEPELKALLNNAGQHVGIVSSILYQPNSPQGILIVRDVQ